MSLCSVSANSLRRIDAIIMQEILSLLDLSQLGHVFFTLGFHCLWQLSTVGHNILSAAGKINNCLYIKVNNRS